MKAKEFEQLFERRVKMCRKTLVQKAEEYSSEEDRLYNFKRGSDFLGQTPSESCLSYMTKQLVSVYDLVQSDKRITQAIIDEKIGDAINYLVLLEGCLHDEGVFP